MACRPSPHPTSPSSAFTITIVHGPDADRLDQTILWDGIEPFTLGRGGEDVDLEIRDEALALRHLQLIGGPDPQLRNLDALEGTFFDGSRIRGQIPLRAGVISAGATLLVLEAAPPPRESLRLEEIPGSAAALTAVVPDDHLRAMAAAVGTFAASVLLVGWPRRDALAAALSYHRASGRTGPFLQVDGDRVRERATGAREGRPTEDPVDRRTREDRDLGTVFVDEIDERSPARWTGLVRALMARNLRAVGQRPNQPSQSFGFVASTAVPAASYDRLHVDLILEALPLARHKRRVLPLFRQFLGPDAECGALEDHRVLETLLLHDWPDGVAEVQRIARIAAKEGRLGTLDRLDLRFGSEVEVRRARCRHRPSPAQRSTPPTDRFPRALSIQPAPEAQAPPLRDR